MPEQAMDGSVVELEAAERVVMRWDSSSSSSSASVGGDGNEPMLFDGAGGRVEVDRFLHCQ
jgi:exocyst complex component 7